MKASALRLEASFLEQVEFKVNHAFDPSLIAGKSLSDLMVDWRLASRTDLEFHAERDLYVTRLTVILAEHSDASSKPPYYFTVAMVGMFNYEQSFPLEKRAGLFASNGPAVLLGAIRELVFSLTSRGPYAPIMLPTANFPADEKAVANVTTALPAGQD